MKRAIRGESIPSLASNATGVIYDPDVIKIWPFDLASSDRLTGLRDLPSRTRPWGGILRMRERR